MTVRSYEQLIIGLQSANLLCQDMKFEEEADVLSFAEGWFRANEGDLREWFSFYEEGREGENL